MPGAIHAIWCDLRGLAKDRQRGLVQPYITAMQIAALAFLAAQHGISADLSSSVLHSLAPLGAGAMLGLALFGRVSDSQFRRVLLSALLVCGLAGYRNDGPYSVTRHLRDAHSAAVMINNDRILANSAGLLLALKDEPELFA